ncbi:MAG TPA: LacI family DNA-binding transcriptional regulator [Pyrinomonadaceae bacterium]|nr:LacI family DNA-binding transcriptional regulator [Pyrinomonadaceae bacterium]
MRLKDVARTAGVSTATVSHVINNTKYVSEATREKVVRAIKECNYYANAHARSLASGRSNIIGLLVSDISNPFFPELVKSIEDAAFESGYNIILVNTNYDADRAADYVRRLIELKVAGVALMTTEFDFQLIDELAARKVPVVLHNVGTTGVHMNDVLVDYASGIDEAVSHLVELGHKRIVHIAGPARFRSAIIRREAFVESFHRYLPGLPEPAIFEGDFKFAGGKQAAERILESQTMPTAVVVANDLMALGAMQEFREAGLEIPRDLSIIGFDDITFAALSEPPLTTVCSPRAEIGRKAIEALMATIKGSVASGEVVRVQTFLIKRRTTAVPTNSTKTEGTRRRTKGTGQ